MTDLRKTIIPKSDQLNSDDLISGPMIITVTKVSLLGDAEQPIAIGFEDNGGKPYKPCKSMRRVMVQAWGPDGNAYTGRSMALYRDPKVKWGGLEVGGIRISHMSDISGPMTMALTETKQSRKPFTVHPLKSAPAKQPIPEPPTELTGAIADWADALEHEIDGATDRAAAMAAYTAAIGQAEWGDLKAADNNRAKAIKAKVVGFKEGMGG